MTRRLALALLALAVCCTSPSAAQGRNTFHDRLLGLSDRERNETLTLVLADERCRVTRSFFQGLDKSGGAHWSVACADGKAWAVMINNDARGSTRVLDCGVMKALGGTECFKRF